MRNNSEIVHGLRSLANWLEAHPEIETYGDVVINQFCDTPAQLASVAREHGPVRKKWLDNYACLRKEFSPQVAIEWNIQRHKICRRVKVGEVPVRLPAQGALPERTEMQAVYEWQCDQPLLENN